jgi:hypothetical protein
MRINIHTNYTITRSWVIKCVTSVTCKI